MQGTQPELAQVVHRNIRALLEVRQQYERSMTPQDHIADRITRFTGSMLSIILHALLFTAWILINLGVVPGIRPWDPFPFVMLAMFASVEAIFLSSFVLVSQNRMAALDTKRADLDLQINLLAEHEITQLITLTDAIAQHLGVNTGREAEVDELKRHVAPETVLAEIAVAEEELEQIEAGDLDEAEWERRISASYKPHQAFKP
jgi:uncharacterized membrane protein